MNQFFENLSYLFKKSLDREVTIASYLKEEELKQFKSEICTKRKEDFTFFQGKQSNYRDELLIELKNFERNWSENFNDLKRLMVDNAKSFSHHQQRLDVLEKNFSALLKNFVPIPDLKSNLTDQESRN